jgi:TolA-binding protein
MVLTRADFHLKFASVTLKRLEYNFKSLPSILIRITMKLKFTLTTLLLLASAWVSVLGQPTVGKEEQDFQFAMGLFKDENYRLAFEQFTEFVKRYPGNNLVVDAEYYRGESAFQEGKLTDAALYFAEFVKRHPDSKLADDAGFREAEVHFRQAAFEQAATRFVEVLETYPEGNLAHESAYWAGESFFKLGNYGRAKKYYTIAFEHFPDGRIRDYAFFSMAYIEEKTRNFDEARRLYDQLLTEYPASVLHPAARTRLAACLYEQRQFESAIRHLDSLADSPDPDNAAERLFLKADSYYLLGRFVEAESLYREFLAAYPHHGRARQVRYSLGWACMEQKKYPEAVTAFEALENGSDELADAARFRKGVVYRLSGKDAEARAIFRALAEAQPPHAYSDNALFELGMLSYLAGDYEPAAQLFTKASALPNSDIEADIYSMIGECSLKLARYKDAAYAFSRATAAKSGDSAVVSAALFRLGYSLHIDGQSDSAAAVFQRYLREQPNGAHKKEALLWLGEAYFASGKYADAAILYNQTMTTDLDPATKSGALYGLGWSYYKSREYSEAEKTFRQLLTDYKGSKFDMDARVRLGDAQFAMKKFSEAARSYRQAAQSFPDHALTPYALLQLGNAEARAGDAPAGLATLKSSLARFPNTDVSDDLQFSIGWLYFQNKDYDVAIGELRKLIETYPKSTLAANAHYTIGDAFYNLGKYAEAERAYRSVVENHADSPIIADALDGIGQAMRMQGRNTEAAAVKEDWLRNHPSNPNVDGIVFATAQKQFQEKDPQGAAVILQSFLKSYPSSPRYQDALVLLGECYRESGRIEDARKTFRQAVDAGPDSDAALDAQVQIASLHMLYQERREAIDIYDRALSKKGTQARHAELRYLKGVALLTDRQDSLARAEFRAAIAADALGGFTDPAWIQIARLDARDGRAADAYARLEEIASRRGDDVGAEAQFAIGDLRYDAGEMAEAEKALLRVGYVYASSSTWVARSWLLAGRLYEKQNEKDKAVRLYKKLTSQLAGTPEAAEAQQRLERLK